MEPISVCTARHDRLRCALFLLCGILLTAGGAGCGTTLSRSATEQLIASDAVDRSVGRIDFRDLSGKKVYLDTQYLKVVKPIGFVNADYIISSLRQQMVAAGLLLQDKAEEADYIVEARVGALGANGHEVTYGVPKSRSLSTVVNTAASMMPAMPALPPLPEISFAEKNEDLAAAKVVVFAYERESRRAVWQSGVSLATSTAKDYWIFGAGPFQNGTIYDEPQFAGEKFRLPFFGREKESNRLPLVEYDGEYHFKTADTGAAASPATDSGFPAEIEQASAEFAPDTQEAQPASPAEQAEAAEPAPRQRGSSVRDLPEDLKLLWEEDEVTSRRSEPPARSDRRTAATQPWWAEAQQKTD